MRRTGKRKWNEKNSKNAIKKLKKKRQGWSIERSIKAKSKKMDMEEDLKGRKMEQWKKGRIYSIDTEKERRIDNYKGSGDTVVSLVSSQPRQYRVTLRESARCEHPKLSDLNNG